MADKIPIQNITKFNGSNLQGWRIQMNALFMANGIKDIVDSITQHFAKVQNMAAQLTDISENVSDVTVMAKILAGLSYKYGSFQTATIIND